MDTIELMCRTPSCSFHAHPFNVEDNGTEIVCSGECQNVLRPDNPDHPNYPEPPEPEETLEDMFRRVIREELGLSD